MEPVCSTNSKAKEQDARGLVRQIAQRWREQEAKRRYDQRGEDQQHPVGCLALACDHSGRLIEEHHLDELDIVERANRAGGNGNRAERHQPCIDHRLKDHEFAVKAKQRRNAR